MAAEATVMSCPGGRVDTVGTVEPAVGGAGLPVVGSAVVLGATPVGIAVGAVETRVGCGVLVAVGAAIVGATAGCPVGAVLGVRVGGACRLSCSAGHGGALGCHITAIRNRCGVTVAICPPPRPAAVDGHGRAHPRQDRGIQRRPGRHRRHPRPALLR